MNLMKIVQLVIDSVGVKVQGYMKPTDALCTALHCLWTGHEGNGASISKKEKHVQRS